MTRSFPSGHTAAAFAFATGAGRELAWAGPPLYALAALVGYSRLHTGVHYPLDVIAGAVAGMALSELTSACIDRTEWTRSPDTRTGPWGPVRI
jgi:membrane-associated phospholipid phosphatase